MTSTPLSRPYCGAGPTPLDIATRWNLDPWLLCALAVLAAVLWRTSGREPRRRAQAMAGMAVLLVGFVSPLCALSSALFSARTIHHVLLVAVAAPLICGRAPDGRKPALWLATGAHAVVFWAWHAPGAYGAALASPGVYWIMQLSLLASAVLFWRAARAASPWPAAGALVLTMTQMSLLGALLTLSPKPLYAPHMATTWAWGLSPLSDQQLAGLFMWIPAGAIYLAAALGRLRKGLGAVTPEAFSQEGSLEARALAREWTRQGS